MYITEVIQVGEAHKYCFFWELNEMHKCCSTELHNDLR